MKHRMAISMGLMALLSGVLSITFSLFLLLIPLLFAACIAIPMFFWKGPMVRPFVWRGLAFYALVGFFGPGAAILGVALTGNLADVVYNRHGDVFAQNSVFTWQYVLGFLAVMVAPAFIWAICLYAAVHILTGGRDKRLILGIAIGTEFVSLAAIVLAYLCQKQIAPEVVFSNFWVIGELLVSGILLGMSLDRRMGAVQYQTVG